MSIKDAKFHEKHIEKILLALGAVFLVAMAWYSFGTDPYTVEVRVGNSTQVVGPAKLEELVKRSTKNLETHINDANPPAVLRDLKVPEYAASMQESLAQDVSPVKALPAFGDVGIVGGRTSGTGTNVTYEIPALAAPIRVGVSSGSAVIDEQAVRDETGRWERLLGQRQSRDFRYVSVYAAFDMVAWITALRNAEPKIPADWYSRSHLLADVLLYRQPVDAITGRVLGEEELVPPMPSDVNFRPFIGPRTNWNPQEASAQLERAWRSQPAIAQSKFVPVTEARPWTPPTGMPALSYEKKVELTDLQRRINLLANQLKALGVRVSGGDDSGVGDFDVAANAGNVDQLRAEWARYVEQRKAILDAAPGFKLSDLRFVDVLAHDLTAKAGMTYRYRIAVAVLNPLFMRHNDLTAEQRRLYAGRMALVSAKSEWTAPVTIEPEYRFFAISGAPNRPSVATANVEVWRITNGLWQKQDFKNIRPGEVVADLGLMLVDVAGDTSATTRAVFLDLPTGQVFDRRVEDDRRDPERTRLAKQAAAAAAPPPAPIN